MDFQWRDDENVNAKLKQCFFLIWLLLYAYRAVRLLGPPSSARGARLVMRDIPRTGKGDENLLRENPSFSLGLSVRRPHSPL